MHTLVAASQAPKVGLITMPLEVKKESINKTAHSGLSGLIEQTKQFITTQRITEKDRMFFTEQLSLLLETGSNLHISLQALQDQFENPAMAELIKTLNSDIADGKPFSQALSRHPNVFSQTYVNLVSASENGGFMHEVLLQLLEMDEKREQLRSTLTSALSYPIFLLLFALGVVIFVLVVVFPKFGEMFTLIEDHLPATTKIFMSASEFFLMQWPLLIVGISAFSMLTFYWVKSTNGQKIMDRIKLKTPVLREIFIKLYLVQSMRVMSMSIKNGVGILETLHACKDVVDNTHFHQFISEVELKIEEGSGIAAGFSNSTFIPSIVVQMITTGEETGNLAKVMGRLADYYERELSKRITTLSQLAEPAMLLVMGAVVGLLVSSLILPIFQLSRAVG